MAKDLSAPWNGYIPPFRVWGNLYFVGTKYVSNHLIDTGDGLILLDTGYAETLYLVLDNIRQLGFDPRDIKYLVHSHGHIDHVAGTCALVAMTGAKTFLDRGDADYVTGVRDLTWARELGMTFPQTYCWMTGMRSRWAIPPSNATTPPVTRRAACPSCSTSPTAPAHWWPAPTAGSA